MDNWNGKRVLITGITGFVGSWLAEELLARGASVVGMQRRGSIPNLSNVAHIADRIKLMEGDLHDVGSLSGILSKVSPHAVFHLAAQSYVPYSFSAPVDTYYTNVIGTANLLEAIRISEKSDIERVHFAGSSEEYGLVLKDEVPIRETNPLRPLSPYGASKVAADFICYTHFKSYGIPVVRTRGFNHTGPRRGPMFVTSKITRQVAEGILLGKKEMVLGNTDAVRDFTDVRDMVNGYLLAVEKGALGDVYNLAQGSGITIGDAARLAMKLGGVKMAIKKDENLLRPSDVMVLVGDNTKAKKELGWAPSIPFEKTLLDMIEFQKAKLKKEC